MKPITKIIIILLCLVNSSTAKRGFKIILDNGQPFYVHTNEEPITINNQADTTPTGENNTAEEADERNGQERNTSDDDLQMKDQAPTPVGQIIVQYFPDDEDYHVQFSTNKASPEENIYTLPNLEQLLSTLCNGAVLNFSGHYISFHGSSKDPEDCNRKSEVFIKSLTDYSIKLNELVIKYTDGKVDRVPIVLGMLMNYVKLYLPAIGDGNVKARGEYIHNAVNRLKLYINTDKLVTFLETEFQIKFEFDLEKLKNYTTEQLTEEFSAFIGARRMKKKMKLRKHK
jgi:hypothetical protein